MISRNNAEHYIWGDKCDGWRLIDEEERSIIHERMPIGTSEVRHFHKRSTQFFFMLSGTMTIEVEGMEYILKEHEGIEVKPYRAHQVFNKSDKDIEFLVISQPNTMNDRIIVD
ncbi:cupin domain-containing protein [Paenibacillus faecalis]|uniref:cupin domain-containing protein n=1 Tax=Paenibacillus faecalis TaxID=2079532 RepID=UPI000D114DC4|nr:cupin domain-containing protein [Paenibacillus faecalis]